MKWKFAASLAVATLALVSLGAARPLASADEPQRVEIDAKRFEFSPSEFTVKKGQPIVIALKSEDIAHGLKFAELDLNLLGAKGQTKELSFTPTQAGDFVAQCSSFCGAGHGGMKLTMHVTE